MIRLLILKMVLHDLEDFVRAGLIFPQLLADGAQEGGTAGFRGNSNRASPILLAKFCFLLSLNIYRRAIFGILCRRR